MADALYYISLALGNVRAFGPGQKLDLRDADGRPAAWTLIVGDNGVGKTTLLECLALMRPVPTSDGDAGRLDAPAPTKVEAALLSVENIALMRLARRGDSETVLEAEFGLGSPLDSKKRSYRKRTLKASLQVRSGELKSIVGPPIRMNSVFVPLLIAYGAGRRVSPYVREGTPTVGEPVDSLFDASVELVDARRILEDLDYAAYKEPSRAGVFLARLKEALCRILPDVSHPDDIVLYGPGTPGTGGGKTGVQVKTSFGEVPLESLSMGYQTMAAWTVDLAWRLFIRYPESKKPLEEPAIVLVDELDLHLHPRWQRDLRRDIRQIFPCVQFIVTAHSPILAQSYLDMNLAVVRKYSRGDDVRGEATTVILNDPAVVRTWRIDQVCQSVLYDLDSVFSPQVQAALERRVRLLQKEANTPEEKEELRGLNDLVARADATFNETDSRALAVIRRAAERLQAREA